MWEGLLVFIVVFLLFLFIMNDGFVFRLFYIGFVMNCYLDVVILFFMFCLVFKGVFFLVDDN